MKKITFLIIALLSINCVFAQQLPKVNYFMYDNVRTNPGSLGSKDMVCATMLLKESFMGFVGEGTPRSFFANIEVPFKLFGARHGVGLSLYNDQIGFYSDFDLKLGYAFRFNVADGVMGIGVNGGIRQKSLDAKWIYGANSNNPTDDPNIPPDGKSENLNGFGVGAGVFYRSEDIYLGASVSNIYSSDINYEASATSTTATSASEKIRPHYYITAGYKYQLSNPAYEIEPAVQFFSDGIVTAFDLNGTLTYNKKIWGGVSYSAGSPVASAVVGMLGFMIMDGLKVGLAYEYNTSAIAKHSPGGYEVLLNYCFKLGVEKSPQRYRSIRYL